MLASLRSSSHALRDPEHSAHPELCRVPLVPSPPRVRTLSPEHEHHSRWSAIHWETSSHPDTSLPLRETTQHPDETFLGRVPPSHQSCGERGLHSPSSRLPNCYSPSRGKLNHAKRPDSEDVAHPASQYVASCI